MNFKEKLADFICHVIELYQSSYANYKKALILVFYQNYAFHNLILPPPSENDFFYAEKSSFEQSVENLIEDIEFIDYEITLEKVLSLLERRYTATSV